MRRHSKTPAVRAAGFTLMELMFTVAVAAVLLGFAVPSFRNMIASNRLGTAAAEISSALAYSRSEAIAHNTTVTFCRANLEASTNCAGSLGEWDFFIVRNTAGTVLRRGALPDYDGTISFESDLTADSVAFSPDGLSRTGGVLVSNSSFSVCSTAVSDMNMRTITLGAGSRVSTSKSTGSC